MMKYTHQCGEELEAFEYFKLCLGFGRISVFYFLGAGSYDPLRGDTASVAVVEGEAQVKNALIVPNIGGL